MKPLLLLLLTPALCLADQTQPALKMPGPEIQELLLGTWSTKVQYEPTPSMPKGGIASGEEKWYPGPGGKSLIEEYHETGSAGEITGLGVAWWDAKSNGYRVLWCESTDPAGCLAPNGLAHWEGKQLVLMAEQELDGKKLIFKEVFSDISAMSFTQTLYIGESTGDLKLQVTIHATRKSYLVKRR